MKLVTKMTKTGKCRKHYKKTKHKGRNRCVLKKSYRTSGGASKSKKRSSLGSRSKKRRSSVGSKKRRK